MDQSALLNGLLLYLCFIPVLTFHEFAHAWMASKCGDDTAKNLGRVSLNPAVHIDTIGTIVLPLLAVTLAAAGSGLAGFIIGWGKPVPVNVSNLHNPRRDDTLVALAGPAMNILLAAVIMGGLKIGVLTGSHILIEMCNNLILVSLFLCFFNLLPIPPLDGSHVLKNAINMPWETYMRLAQYGFIFIIIAIQVPQVRALIAWATFSTYQFLASIYRL